MVARALYVGAACMTGVHAEQVDVGVHSRL